VLAFGETEMAEDKEFDPLRLLQEDLKDDDQETIVSATNKLETIAIALGPARVKSDLLPFLTEYSETDNDEAQTNIARQMGNLVPHVGGAANAHILLPLLEKYAGEEEFVVREAAVDSLNKIATQLPKADIGTKYIPLIRRLANGDWFTSRVSACGLFHVAYPHAPDTLQGELRGLFANLCNDDTPMVKKAAFQNLGKFAIALQKQYFKTDILPVLKSLSVDEMDSMRIHVVVCCVQLANKMDPADFAATLLPLIEAVQDDTSWRVRSDLCKQMPELCKNVDPQIAQKKLVPIYAKLLRDKEAEVRTMGCRVLAEVCAIVKTGLTEIVSCLEAVATDGVAPVRVAFSKSLIPLCNILGKEVAGKTLIPIITQMCTDENSEVRGNIVDSVDQICEADQPGGGAIITAIINALMELSKDPKWRVRQSVVDKSTLLAKCVGVKNFDKKLQGIVIAALSDHVFSIREHACVQIGEIVKEYGCKWAAERFFRDAFKIYDKNTNYLHRMTCLAVMSACAPHCNSEIIDKHLLPWVLLACEDDVPNVRIAGAKTMGDLLPNLDKTLGSSKVRPLLTKMLKDTDVDVCYFSSQSLLKCP